MRHPNTDPTSRIRGRVNGRRRTAPAIVSGVERNRLLTLLAGETLLESAERLELPVGLLLCEPNVPLDGVYFPQSAMLSVLEVMADGAEIEVASIGNEGSTASPLLNGGAVSTSRCIVQVRGIVTRVSLDAMGDAVAESPRVRHVIEAYTKALFAQVTQSVACNGRHSVALRCARWLLEAHDRAGADEFELPQGFLAVMLGVRRPSVTAAEQILRDAGLIQYKRARMRIVDREGLERASCECYRTVKDEFDRLLPIPPAIHVPAA
jgi:CRP-like cAMP-binding protein